MKDNYKLWEIFGEYKEYLMGTYPEWATYEGDHRFDDRVTDISEEAVRDNYTSLKKFLNETNKINFKALSEDNKINYILFKEELTKIIDGEFFKPHYMPINQLTGIHIDLPQIAEFQKLENVHDYERYFLRLKNASKQIRTNIKNMQKGIKSGLTFPEYIMNEVLEQINEIKDPPVEKNPFYLLLLNDKYLKSYEREKVDTGLKSVISEYIIPSYQNLFDFIKNEYIPYSRKEDGIWSVPGGNDYYKYQVRYHTSTELKPEEIHLIGLNEVKRIRDEMEEIKNKTGFKGTLQEFNEYLRTSPDFYFSKPEDLLDGYRKIIEKMDKKLPEFFGKLPKAICEVKELEEYRAKNAPQAYYYSSPEDRSRPAYFYANTFDLSARPKYTMTALSLHEAVPGHHLQISLAQEIEVFPWFRKQLGITAFIEGWGLYAESLGYEAGLYEDLYQRYGALTYEMERACRLVIDTGLHYKKWTRQQSINYMKENTPTSEVDIQAEVDRYVIWPGQALAYKIGELKIKELRKISENELGPKFKIKEFHDNILVNGTVPLSLLEKNIKNWIEKTLWENQY